MNLTRYIERHRKWSHTTFGDVASPESVTKHIRKELDEIMEHPSNPEEWIDVMILAIDGAWRFTGLSPADISETLEMKQRKNMAREWTVPIPGEPTEHVR